MKYKYIHYNENDTLNGMFVFLNEHYPKLFEIKATTHNDVAGTSPRDITKRDRNKSKYWATANNDLEMIISFTHHILLTSYTIENIGKGHSWMMNWTIFGSNDKTNWEIIDQRKGEIFCESPYPDENLGLHCSDSKNLSYFVENPKFYSQFKIRNDLNSCEGPFIMRSLEFHGLTTFQSLCTIILKVTVPQLISSYIAILLP